MIIDEASSPDEQPATKADLSEFRKAPAISGCIGASHASHKFANIGQAMDNENEPAAVSELRRLL